jgi:hypothetical protein
MKGAQKHMREALRLKTKETTAAEDSTTKADTRLRWSLPPTTIITAPESNPVLLQEQPPLTNTLYPTWETKEVVELSSAPKQQLPLPNTTIPSLDGQQLPITNTIIQTWTADSIVKQNPPSTAEISTEKFILEIPNAVPIISANSDQTISPTATISAEPNAMKIMEHNTFTYSSSESNPTSFSSSSSFSSTSNGGGFYPLTESSMPSFIEPFRVGSIGLAFGLIFSFIVITLFLVVMKERKAIKARDNEIGRLQEKIHHFLNIQNNKTVQTKNRFDDSHYGGKGNCRDTAQSSETSDSWIGFFTGRK